MYEKTNWNTGDKITAEKLNNIEDGIANITTGVFPILIVTDEEVERFDKTWTEINNALANGLYCSVYESSQGLNTQTIVDSTFTQESDGELEYYVTFGDRTGIAQSANDYPVLDNPK